MGKTGIFKVLKRSRKDHNDNFYSTMTIHESIINGLGEWIQTRT
jgi:hypothetical protein